MQSCRVLLTIAFALLAGGVRADMPVFNLPEVPREFRAVWIATVDNIDWPSETGLSTAEQQAELRDLLDMCVAVKMNAIVFQVRPVADALYESPLEPWSAFLSGTQGVAPDPYYDPLAFVIDEAARRGIEVHAWLNPYRAAHPANDTVADTHVRKTHPEWTHKYGPYWWMDPGHPEALAHTLAVIEDLVTRYDLAGIHFDDYFYPYPVPREEGGNVPFPDDATWEAYERGGGELSRDDWRRDNINRLVQQIYELVREKAPHVEVGFSPFGIWRPGTPQGIAGFDAYASLYADARLWLHEGWLDYMVPQLYWAIDPPGQSYPVLLRWWTGENRQARNLYAGNAAHRALATNRGWGPDQLARQVQVTREQAGADGNVFFSAKWFLKHPEKVAGPIAELYETPALIPASPWLDDTPPPAPIAFATGQADQRVLRILPEGDEPLTHWTVQARTGDTWSLQIVPIAQETVTIGLASDTVAVRTVDRVGNLSPPTILALP